MKSQKRQSNPLSNVLHMLLITLCNTFSCLDVNVNYEGIRALFGSTICPPPVLHSIQIIAPFQICSAELDVIALDLVW